jgi:DeoR/GlpR family transcriptional regulator of sugar metabolism
MKAEDRLEKVLSYVEDESEYTYKELGKLLGVSIMTVRRDADRLVAKGGVIKTLGGIKKISDPSNLYESPILSRLSVNLKEKRLIAREALRGIQPGETIYLDGSSTCLQFAKLLTKEIAGLTVVTNSALAYLELVKNNENTIICIGGQHDFLSYSMVGSATEREAQKYYFDKVFMSTKGFIPTEGTYESSVPTITIKQIVAKRCAELILLLDHTKFWQRALQQVLDISQIHTLITDDGVSEEDIEVLKKKIGSVHVTSAMKNEPLEEATK